MGCAAYRVNLQYWPGAFKDFPSKARGDSDLALFAVCTCAENFQYVWHRLRSDRDFCASVLTETNDVDKILAVMSPQLKKDMGLMSKAVKKSASALQYVDETLKSKLFLFKL